MGLTHDRCNGLNTTDAQPMEQHDGPVQFVGHDGHDGHVGRVDALGL